MVIVRFVSAPGYDNIGLMSEFMSDRFHFVTRLKHGEFYCRYKPDLCLTSGYTMRVAWLIDKTASTVAISRRRYPFFLLFLFFLSGRKETQKLQSYVCVNTHRRSIKFCKYRACIKMGKNQKNLNIRILKLYFVPRNNQNNLFVRFVFFFFLLRI